MESEASPGAGEFVWNGGKLMGKLDVAKERKLFEHWIGTWKPTPPSLAHQTTGGNYADMDVHMAWLSWKASAEAER